MREMDRVDDDPRSIHTFGVTDRTIICPTNIVHCIRYYCIVTYRVAAIVGQAG